MGWRTEADKSVCAGCSRGFMKSLDCAKCEVDGFAAKYQAEWLAGGKIMFMGVDVSPALEHPARELPIIAKRRSDAPDSL